MATSSVLRLSGPIVRTRLAESVYEHVLDAILSGTLAGGVELSEVALAAELGVSRTPVHEALRRLATDGLVTVESNRQARVASFGRRDVVEIYEMRGLLEPAAAERAATRIDPAALADLRRNADALASAPESADWPSRAIRFDIDFHDALAQAADNARLQADVSKYRHLVRAFCRLSGGTGNLRCALEEHRVILDALEAADGQAASRAMRDHIAARLAAVLRELDRSASAAAGKA